MTGLRELWLNGNMLTGNLRRECFANAVEFHVSQPDAFFDGLAEDQWAGAEAPAENSAEL